MHHNTRVPQSAVRAPRSTCQRGYVLLPVVLVISLVAVIGFLLGREGAMNTDLASGTSEAAQASYLAEAGIKHANWLVQQSGCVGDLTIPDTALGSHKYTATVNSQAVTTDYSFDSDRDTWLKEAAPNDNFGGEGELPVKNKPSDNTRAVYHFDLSSITPGTRVVTATLKFYVTVNDDLGDVKIHLLTQDWTESGATWNSLAADFEVENITSIPPQTTHGWVTLTLTGVAQAWVNDPSGNHGIILIATSNDKESKYTSKEYSTASSWPKLEVTTSSGYGSPVDITATGMLANGVSRTRSRSGVKAYQPVNTISLQPHATEGKDAWITSGQTNWNYGAHVVMRTQENAGQRSLLEFNLSNLPFDVTVINAQLELYVDRLVNSGLVEIHAVTTSWMEGTCQGAGCTADGATWDSYDGTNTWSTSGSDHVAEAAATTDVDMAATWFSWDITALVQDWAKGKRPNFGMLLKTLSGSEVDFVSSDHTTVSQHPKLTITYACECGIACLAPQGSGKLLLVVGDPANLTNGDAKKKALFKSWGYTVTLIADNANQSTFDTEVANNDAAYVSESVGQTELGTKLTNAAIGLVNEEGESNDEFGIASSFAWPVGNAINVTDTTHYITSVFPAGMLRIFSHSMEGLSVAGPQAPGLQILTDWGGAGSLVVLETGATSYIFDEGSVDGTRPAAGRRVMLPLGREANLNWNYLNNNGQLIVQRALQWATENNGPVVSDPIILSTASPATLGGLDFDDIDLAEYDPVGNSATLFFEGALTTLNSDIDALHVLENGNFLLSTKDAATLEGLSFADGDLVEYDPAADTAVLNFDESEFSTDEDITSVYVMDNGRILLSTESDATLGGLSFTDNDLVEYDPGSNTATLYFDGSMTTLTSDIDAVHMLENGHIVLSTKDDASLGGLSFKDGDLVDYDPATDVAVLYFDEARFPNDEDVISAHIGPGSGGGGDNFRDEFNTDAFNNNNGTFTWGGDWIEVDGDGAGPTAGNAQISGGQLNLDDRPNTGGDPSLAREVDLSSYASATLSFNFEITQQVDSSDSVVLEISDNGGTNWTELENFTGISSATTDTRSYDISTHMSANTQIRFRVNNGYGGNNEKFYVDDLDIVVAGGS